MGFYTKVNGFANSTTKSIQGLLALHTGAPMTPLCRVNIGNRLIDECHNTFFIWVNYKNFTEQILALDSEIGVSEAQCWHHERQIQHRPRTRYNQGAGSHDKRKSGLPTTDPSSGLTSPG
jgi:hypothetical protein